MNSIVREFEKYIITEKSDFISNHNIALTLNEYYDIKIKIEREKFELFKEKKVFLNNEINRLQNLLSDDIEIQNLINERKYKLYELENQNKYLKYKYGSENELMNDEVFSDDFSNEYLFESNDEEYDFTDENHEHKLNYSSREWDNYTDDNPWLGVFGPGDEAETAYWNCD
ncbi:hypothetical protein [Cloacibacterium normanense]|uniref:Uncharacterized protein n=1 Tax=Cloacibacterium normanense TaxID=237258 RepID=A0A1E5UDY2_9FLAO|nr:hypothetical protein [Cloacibacterium normanense]AZI69767.1 hypothetical protein EB819_07695 [Cloacibacterium normanense]OEL11092.1 hypothetical protein BHF72_2446 [Cloacibacterium normanense]SDO87630.1 hypothetical protein SAMN04489756_12421 [Cloacibacterium normanense]